VLPATGAMNFAPLSAGDWVLVLDNADLNLPPPGTIGLPLPVELVNLSAQVRKNEIVLSWQTSSETNNYGFEIQRSQNQRNYDKIGFVRGQGTITHAMSYSFVDHSISQGKYYYRLKQIDTDGGQTFSQTVEINPDAPAGFELQQNYPNPYGRMPFNPHTIIFYTLPESGFVNLKIYDIQGKEVAALVQEFQRAGRYSVNFDGSDLASGLYFYKIQINDFVNVKKMVLLNQGR
jgi:hypothetical protein